MQNPIRTIFKGHLEEIKISANVYNIQPKHSDFGKKPITVLVTHGSGFPKELYEPMLRHSVDSIVNKDIYIEKMVSIDFYSYGESAVLNSDFIEASNHKSNWIDNSRDILSIINQLGLKSGDVVGIGHSMGGCCLLAAEVMCPSIFRCIICLDSSFKVSLTKSADISKRVAIALRRRNNFKSKEDFKQYLLSKPLFKTWRLEIIDAYAEHGLKKVISDGKEIWKLKCDPITESKVFYGKLLVQKLYEDKLELIGCPVILVQAMNSNLT
ncbi:hypothetical protein BB558_002799 [Smittium angustum]|uniref:AB hydrolase-1 domain-containing protein n=1 Tax=Smittium angustum TaxID=133377 RepID=A0A2U1J7N5_SMIAN|nr:hypothetical protein BB558_002799 [Smittium angustum]